MPAGAPAADAGHEMECTLDDVRGSGDDMQHHWQGRRKEAGLGRCDWARRRPDRGAGRPRPRAEWRPAGPVRRSWATLTHLLLFSCLAPWTEQIRRAARRAACPVHANERLRPGRHLRWDATPVRGWSLTDSP